MRIESIASACALFALAHCAVANLPFRQQPSHHDTDTNTNSRNGSLPGLVDLGYAKHVPTYINSTASGKRVAIYQNIRFANAPTGDLRFRNPDTNLPTEPGIQDGHVPWASRDCIASAPAVAPFPGVNGTSWGHEDCLFLDVYVPEGVRPGDDVPVLHFFFGSGYAFGSKNIFFSPLGLFDLIDDGHGIGPFIVVINNYRLGALGWTYSEGEDMDGNLGMMDCLAAAEWTGQFIDRFGGDGNRITAAGQSAGAGILYYLSVLDDGKRQLPFQRAFLSSPAAPPRRHVQKRQTQIFDMVLEATNCTTLACLREVPESVLSAANNHLVSQVVTTSGGGVFGPLIGFGPAPAPAPAPEGHGHGHGISDMPLALFGQGQFNRGLDALLIGSMAREGMTTSHDIGLPAYFPTMVRQILPDASDDVVSHLESLYSWPEDNPAQLAWDWTTDAIFGCNAYNLAGALPDKTRRYIMSVPPAVHGMDLLYIFYNDPESTPVPSVQMARAMQHKVLAFIHGRDYELEKGGWPLYGGSGGGGGGGVSSNNSYAGMEEQSLLINITASNGLGPDAATSLRPELRHRCEEIARAVLDPKNGA